jgi:hypothetical protein
MKKLFTILFISLGLIIPLVSLADLPELYTSDTDVDLFGTTESGKTTTGSGVSGIKGGDKGIISLASQVLNLFQGGIPMLLIGIAFLVFCWGIVGYLYNADNEEKRKEMKQFMIWGIIGIFVIVSVFILAKILVGLFGISGGIPTLPKCQDGRC